jgi:hypothetical protein
VVARQNLRSHPRQLTVLRSCHGARCASLAVHTLPAQSAGAPYTVIFALRRYNAPVACARLPAPCVCCAASQLHCSRARFAGHCWLLAGPMSNFIRLSCGCSVLASPTSACWLHTTACCGNARQPTGAAQGSCNGVAAAALLSGHGDGCARSGTVPGTPAHGCPTVCWRAV